MFCNWSCNNLPKTQCLNFLKSHLKINNMYNMYTQRLFIFKRLDALFVNQITKC